MLTGNRGTIRTNDGVNIAYTTHGEGSRNLLFVHGWGGAGTGDFWDETLAHLNLSGLRVILADLRGHGASDEATSGYTTERFAEDMFAVADAVGAESFVLVAYSMSGRWAQWMACTQPERISGLILIAPVPAADIPFPDSVKDQWLQVARDKNIATFDPWVHQFTKDRLRPEILQAYFDTVTNTPQFSLSATLDMCRQGGQFMDRLLAIRAATLVIGGCADPMLPPEVLRSTIVTQISGARLFALDCGHEIPLEKPQETAALIEAFVAGLGELERMEHHLSIESSKAILKRFWEEGFNQVDTKAISEFVAADYHNHDMLPGEQNGIEGLIQFIRLTHAAFPDMRVIADKIVAEGDVVVTRWSIIGTHNGEFMGVPPTGRPITITGLAMHRIENGEVKEGWNNWDALGLLQQVGAIPNA